LKMALYERGKIKYLNLFSALMLIVASGLIFFMS
jgi:hypothetical protein